MTVWRRSPSDEPVPFHRYCALSPIRIVRDGGRISFSLDTGVPEAGGSGLRYARGLTRGALRYTPSIVGVAILFHLVRGSIVPGVVGVGRYVGSPLPAGGAGVVLLLAWLLLLGLLLQRAGVLPGRGAATGVVVYAELLLLLGGLAAAIYLVAFSPGSGLESATAAVGLRDHVAFASGFLLMALLGGLLVYDGMLKTENMFSNLHLKRETIVSDPAGYREFLDDFERALDHQLATDLGREWLPEPIRNPRTVYVFAVLFVAPFVATGVHSYLATTGTTLLEYLTDPILVAEMAIPSLINVFLVAVFFQFLVLVKFFNDLLTVHGPREAGGDPMEPSGGTPAMADGGTDESPAFTLQYRPFHPDGLAGFKDIGQFATRVNLLLVVGGLYVVQRLYVHGTRYFPVDAAGALSADVLSWAVNFVGPVVFYVVAVVVWLYFSFWQTHKTMRRGKEIRLSELAGGTTEERQLGLELQRDGPVWPVGGRYFFTILSLDVLPILGLLPVVPR